MSLFQEAVVLINVVLATIILVKKISPSPILVHGDKFKKFNDLDFKRWITKDTILFYYLELDKDLN